GSFRTININHREGRKRAWCSGNELAATDCAGFAGRWRDRGVRAGEGEDAGRGLR
ncbi:unnamed protein product, partial [Plutella xylostella]